MSTDPILRLEHRTGERIRYADLRDARTAAEVVQAWHNRALHGTYGVADGLAVGAQFDPVRGWTVHVAPGLAYDRAGRRLVVPRPVKLPLTTVPHGTVLALAITAAGTVLEWRRTADFHPDDGVALAKTRPGTEMKPVQPAVDTGNVPARLLPWLELAGSNLVAIRGQMSKRDIDELLRHVPDATHHEPIKTAFADWPFLAPVRNRRQGLGVRIERGPEGAANPAWVAVVSPGSVRFKSGTAIEVAVETTVNVNTAGEKDLLVLRPGPAFVWEKVPPPSDEIAEVLGDFKHQPPTVDVGALVGATPSPAYANILNGLATASKLDKSNASSPKWTGWLTQGERDRLIRAAFGMDTGFALQLQRDLAGPPLVPPVPAESEPAPFFPVRSRPLARPRSGSGITIAGRTDWKLSVVAGRITYTTTIAWDAVGFTRAPEVFAWLTIRGRSNASAPDLRVNHVLACEVVDTGITVRAFSVRLWDWTGALGRDDAALEMLREQVSVAWVAFQTDPVTPLTEEELAWL